MDELLTALLIKFKRMKGITDTESDDVFLFALETAVQDVLIYCNLTLDEFPILLDNTVVLMAWDIFTQTSLLNADSEALGETKSHSEGDFSYTRETKAEVIEKIMNSNSIAKNYKRYLNAYRKMRK